MPKMTILAPESFIQDHDTVKAIYREARDNA